MRMNKASINALMVALAVSGCAEVETRSPAATADWSADVPDRAPAPGELVLEVDPVDGITCENVRLSISSAPVDADVHFALSASSGSPACPAALAPDCLDLAPPLVHLGKVRADASGTAVLVKNLPAGAAGASASVQAASIAPTGTSVSNVIEISIPPECANHRYASVEPSCGPSGEEAYLYTVGLTEPTCGAGTAGSWVSVLVWGGLLPPESGATYNVDPSADEAAFELHPGSIAPPVQPVGGELTIDTWDPSGTSRGTYDATLETGDHVVGSFTAVWCEPPVPLSC